jgi:sulfite reductase (ferredoxin)
VCAVPLPRLNCPKLKAPGVSPKDKAKPSALESVKSESRFLRGDIGAELASNADSFGKDSIQLLKHHGSYQQDDRDQRAKSPGGKSAKSYSMMVRTRLPGGRLSSKQLLAELDLCDELGNTTLRITSRQGLQLHGILKCDLKQTIRRINDVQLSTLAACGDVMRNVMCCPAPHAMDPVHAQMQSLADEFARHFCPRTRAYHEIWLTDPDSGDRQLAGGGPPPVAAGTNGESHRGGSLGGQPSPESGPVEPIYGPTYLPRKFKTAIGLPGDNCVDLYTHDLGLMAICESYNIVGYNVLVGGGQGVTPSAKKTFPALARRMAFIAPEQAIDVATAVVGVQRDFGNRSDRKVARLKYLIADWGLERFKATVEQYYGAALPDPHPEDVWGFDDHIGWNAQGDGRWFYGLNVENGRICDRRGFRLKSALRAICGELAPGIRLTSHQSMLFTDIAIDQRDRLEAILVEHDVPLSESISPVRRWSMACVGLPTCGLSITDSERVLPSMIDQLEVELARLGLSSDAFTLRMTGCPNGCARPYNSDIGLVGKSKGTFTIFLGGRLLGDRLNEIYEDSVPTDLVVPRLVPVFVYYRRDRQGGESFGDFCHRKGIEDLRRFADQFALQAAK